MIQVKDVIERLNYFESSIIRMNIGKTKLDNMLQIDRLARVKTGLGYVCEKNIKHVVDKSNNLGGVWTLSEICPVWFPITACRTVEAIDTSKPFSIFILPLPL